MKLNLGACDRRIDGFVSVDIAEPADQIVDLSVYPWPWETSSVEEIKAFDVIEHLPDRIATMNEMHRVLQPYGRVHIIVPSADKGSGWHQDPTHKSAWCRNSFQYYQHGSFAQQRLAKSYGITASFIIVSMEEKPYRDAYDEVFKIDVVLEAVK